MEIAAGHGEFDYVVLWRCFDAVIERRDDHHENGVERGDVGYENPRPYSAAINQ